MSQGFTGGCLCGVVRYEVKGAPVAMRLCYCRVCQYFACGGPAANLQLRAADVSLSGPLKDYRSQADSGNSMCRRFCAECGTQVASTSSGRPDLLVLRAGTLDNPAGFQPQAAIWVSRAPAWVCMDPELPNFAEQPPPR